MCVCSMYSKELLKGTLAVIILNLLAENGRVYGYQIYQHVKQRSDGKVLLKDGSLYPALQRMSKDGLLTYEEEYIGKRVRKYYLLTAKGKIKKTAYLDELKDFIATLNKVISPQPNAVWSFQIKIDNYSGCYFISDTGFV